MALIVKKSGILDTIQDLGRFGFMRYGVNPNGAMDRTALRLLNTLLGNDENEAGIECHFPACEYAFDSQCTIAIGGADFGADVDGLNVHNWKPAAINAGSVLRFREQRFGKRAYIVVKGGMQADIWLGSKSTNLTIGQGGFNGRKLQKGDRIDTRSDLALVENTPSISSTLLPFYSNFPTVRVMPGPEFENLHRESQERLFLQSFHISPQSNRMGYRLIGDDLAGRGDRECISGAVTFGTLQLLPGNQLIVLMADHQTAGGYPRVATVIEQDLSLLAQVGPNDKIAFHRVSLEESERISAGFERDLAWLKIGSRFIESKPV